MHFTAESPRRRAGRTLLALGLLAGPAAVLRAADPAAAPEIATATASPPPPPPSSATANIENLIDRLPDLLDFGIPGFAPGGAVRLYTHPHVSDLIHEDYFRLPVGARFQATDHVELTGELGSYFTHGLADSAGYGLYELRVGAKYEQRFAADAGASVGADLITPLSRPPEGITDGIRHIVPYVSTSRTLNADLSVVGFSTLAADFVARTELPPDYRKNQLHSDALLLTVGAAREWPRFRVILAATVGDTTLLSDESKQVYALRPSLVIPLMRRPDSTARATLTFAGRIVRGPDGTDLGINTSVRIDLKYRRGRRDR